MNHLLAYITVKDKEEAEMLSRGLLENRLVACVNISSEVESHYWWQGKLEKATERVLIAKTVDSKKEDVCEWVKQHHSYDCPCVVFLPIEGGNEAFLKWLSGQVLEIRK